MICLAGRSDGFVTVDRPTRGKTEPAYESSTVSDEDRAARIALDWLATNDIGDARFSRHHLLAALAARPATALCPITDPALLTINTPVALVDLA